jgi:hypothetical protein
MSMTGAAKGELSKTIRELREYLLGDPANGGKGALHDAVETAYRMSVRARDAGLDEASRVKRARLETWAREQARAGEAATGKISGKKAQTEADFVREAEKQAGYTLLNRLVILRLLEEGGFRKPAVVSAGWASRAYLDFRQLAQALVRDDESEGYAFLLRLVFEDLAVDLPGIYGPAGVADLVPVTAPILRHVVEALASPLLTSCWTDDMTLGWVYQYWNDPEREAIDAKLNAGGKVETHEIASKTQIFTERYMVDWLLQNSLGPMWLAMCKKHGWTPEVEANGTLARLDERRAEWRAKRDAGEVALTELMPLHTDEERRWAYYVPQPIPDDAVSHAPESVRDLKILDPAVGSGHFLVVAFDLLVALYREEARHRGEVGQERWSDRAIVERILEHNLHGLDIDPRAVQIAAAALWLKARAVSPEAHPHHLNLVASNLRLGSLPDDDPAFVELRLEVERETGMPAALTDRIVHALKGADHLGSLLKVDAAVDEAIRAHETELATTPPAQIELYGEAPEPKPNAPSRTAVKANLLDRLEGFLARHSGGDDLGLRLRGEQLATGVRFVRLVREGQYDLVAGNPPYQGTSKMVDAKYVASHYPRGKADLYAAFLERGLQFVRKGGVSALLTLRNWMFIKQYLDLRMWLLETWDLRALGDFDRGAFEEVLDEVVSVVVSVFRKAAPMEVESVALQPTTLKDRSRDSERTTRKRAAVRSQVGRHQFDPAMLRVVLQWPVLYWWSKEFLSTYASCKKIGDDSPVREGMSTSDNARFVLKPWEVRALAAVRTNHLLHAEMRLGWVPTTMGAEAQRWFEPLNDVVRWHRGGLEMQVLQEGKYGSASRRIQSRDKYFVSGVAYSAIGHSFSARAHRYRSIFGSTGSSVFPTDVDLVLCLLNASSSAQIASDLNPTLHFTQRDVERIPLFPLSGASEIISRLESVFSERESVREPSYEFRQPGPTSWSYAQEWAQRAVDRPDGSPIPSFSPVYDAEKPTDQLSFTLGVVLGRFGPNGEGIRDSRPISEGGDDLSLAMPNGVLFLDGTLDSTDLRDGLGHLAAEPLHKAWTEYGSTTDTKYDNVRDWLRLDFFCDVHHQMYEKRPIHWPLSSASKTFVAWINIHRWDESTLKVLQADHLNPAMTRLEGELNDLHAAMASADKKTANAAAKRFAKVQKWRDELAAFIALVEQCAEKGPPPTDAHCPPREVDARYVPDLDDGVMINSAALWPLLEPQWKDPKKWWKELATAQGKKDYDWSHLAMRYWPTRVDAKCQNDPSLGVAHGCFWKYHPARAWAWELRLQDEIGPDFRIEEAPYRGDGGDAAHRALYLEEWPVEALAAIEKEARRRRLKQRQPQAELRILEEGLWSAVPHLCWGIELSVIKKQGADFKLIAPDEPEARAAFEDANPDRVQGRIALLESFAEQGDLPEAADEDDEPDELDDEGDATEEADE